MVCVYCKLTYTNGWIAWKIISIKSFTCRKGAYDIDDVTFDFDINYVVSSDEVKLFHTNVAVVGVLG